MKKKTFTIRSVEHITCLDAHEETDHEYIERIVKIAKASHDVNAEAYFDFMGKPLIYSIEDLEEVYGCEGDMSLNILLGKDWFILYSDYPEYIFILDCLRTEPENRNERRQQLSELNQAFRYILYKSLVFNNGIYNGAKEIVSDFREDTSYYIYLFKKRHGEIEQIGEDWFSTWGHNENIQFSSNDQEEFFLNFRQTKKPKRLKEIRLHTISFRPSENIIKKFLENQDKYKNLYSQNFSSSEDDNCKG